MQLHNVTVRFGRGRQQLTAVDSVSLQIPPGSTVGLVGESGCGKSTLARAIVGLLRIESGAIKLDGEDYSSHRKRNSQRFRRQVQMVFQDPYSSLNPRMTVGDALGEALNLSDTPRRDVAREVALLLEKVGLPRSAVDRYPHQFSGGQRQRAAIARALAARPRFVICDEVTSALDVSVQGAILNMLQDLQTALELTYLFISHDLSTIRYMSDSIAVMYLGRVVEVATADEIFNFPNHPYTRALLTSVPEVGKERCRAPLSGDLPDPTAPPAGCRFHPRCPEGPVFISTREICRQLDPTEVSPGKAHLATCHFAEQEPTAIL